MARLAELAMVLDRLKTTIPVITKSTTDPDEKLLMESCEQDRQMYEDIQEMKRLLAVELLEVGLIIQERFPDVPFDSIYSILNTIDEPKPVTELGGILEERFPEVLKLLEEGSIKPVGVN